MRAPLYLACWAVVAVCGAAADDGAARYGPSPIGAAGEPNAATASRRLLEPVDVAADRETVAYLLPRLAAKYRPSGDWADVTDPRFYVLTEMAEAAAAAQADADEAGYEGQMRPRNVRKRRYNFEYPRSIRGMESTPKLSIIAPIDSLRKLYKQVQEQKQAERNRKILENLPNFQ